MGDVSDEKMVGVLDKGEMVGEVGVDGVGEEGGV